MTTLEKLSLILEPELVETIEKCSMYFECSSKDVLKLALEELWNRREEVYKSRQTIILRNRVLEKQTSLF